MLRERYEQAARLFEEAIALVPEHRTDFLVKSVKGDVELLHAVQRLIEYDQRAEPTADLHVGSPLVNLSGGNLTGKTIGKYQITAWIGEGAFGAVYKAEQAVPVRRTVAVKVLKAGMDSQQIMARFDVERQALAKMEHPGIARVIDAGQTDAVDGSRPYFVMELVMGEPITVSCERARLPLEARLELFCLVCQAVQHAHQRGIIHRDLKPSNILVCQVDGIAVPKVIDFGIAKALHQPLTDIMVMTNRMELLGTPQYMSPEQANANEQAIDTRTDVYSLGVVLYELLTGSPPLDEQALQGASYSRMIELIREHRVERPSTRVSHARGPAAEHPRDALALERRLRGDLDWIMLKALDVDRERRYESPAAFAEDLRRYLRHEPVMARPPSAVYRTRKFVRRHRVGVAAALLVTLTLIGGVIGTSLGMVRARDSSDQAHAINQFMRDVLTGANPENRGADVRLADVIRDASRTASDRFAGHPELEAQVRTLLADVFHSLDMLQPSWDEFRRAVELWNSSVGPDDPRTMNAELRYGTLLANQNAGRDLLKLVDDLGPRIARHYGRDHLMNLEIERLRCMALLRLARFDDAERLLVDLWRQVEHSDVDRMFKITILDALAMTYAKHAENAVEAQQMRLYRLLEIAAQKLLALAEPALGAEAQYTIRAQTLLGKAAIGRRDYQTAANACKAVLAATLKRYGECHRDRVFAATTLALAEHRLGEVQHAANLYLAQIDCLRNDASQKLWLLSLINDSLPYMERAQQYEQGERLAHELADLMKPYAGHGSTGFGAECYEAYFISMQARADEADPLFQRLRQRLIEESVDDSGIATFNILYGGHLIRRGRFEEAESTLNSVVPMLDDLRNGTWSTHPDNVIVQFLTLYRAWHKPEKVSEYERLQQQALDPRDEQGHLVSRW